MVEAVRYAEEATGPAESRENQDLVDGLFDYVDEWFVNGWFDAVDGLYNRHLV